MARCIAGVDFFTVPTATLQLLHLFFVIHHDRRRILQLAITEHFRRLLRSYLVFDHEDPVSARYQTPSREP